ncbi:hypothetical protein BZA05DRAFT_116781 [Tricharina praecox]|uniref:uncharacterized protein n=1 Tax=Tricharina praecox TaxID=43433 RepID=UPI00221FD6D2|nr:uncharacterized protein BZA05DRAFT_116781 [Tricharina praecox]KAI5858140.1 hypothetical protein BZA05DRAFT_116781 [Tricharina praecox]
MPMKRSSIPKARLGVNAAMRCPCAILTCRPSRLPKRSPLCGQRCHRRDEQMRRGGGGGGGGWGGRGGRGRGEEEEEEEGEGKDEHEQEQEQENDDDEVKDEEELFTVPVSRMPEHTSYSTILTTSGGIHLIPITNYSPHPSCIPEARAPMPVIPRPRALQKTSIDLYRPVP